MELRIDQWSVDRARNLAREIVAPVQTFIARHSTVAVERATLRLLGVEGVGHAEIPLPNLVVDALRPEVRAAGAAAVLGAAIAETGLEPSAAARALAGGELDPKTIAATPQPAARAALQPHTAKGLERIAQRRAQRETFLRRLPQSPAPLLYVIVASGNIYEDRAAAVAAAEGGAQIIAVIRSTGQSLLDFVPEGATTEGSVERTPPKKTSASCALRFGRCLGAARPLCYAHQLR